MRKHIILFFSALLFLSACKPAGDDTNGIIGQDDMVKLLVDIHLTDGYLATQPNNDSLFKYGTGQYEYIFKKHSTDSASFKKSFRYYTMHDEQMVKMYEEVTKVLQAKNDSLLAVISKEQEINNKRQEKEAKRIAKIKQDSIQKKFKEVLESVRKDSIARAKKDSIQKAKAAAKKKPVPLKPKKTNTTKIK